MWEMIERMAADRLWIYTAIAGSVFGAIFAKIFLKEEFGRKKTLGILLIVLGAFLISIF